MEAYRPYGGPYPKPSENRLGFRVLAALAALLTIAAMGAVAFMPPEKEGGAEEVEGVHPLGVSHLVYPAGVQAELPQPGGGQWSWQFPAATVEAGGALFVLDTGNNQVLKLDTSGTAIAAMGTGAALDGPMAMATDGDRLYVANSLASQIVVMNLDGAVEKTIALAQGPGDTVAPRPIGIAVLQSGGLAVSDADNHRVLFLDASGNVVRAVGTGARAGGTDGFNVPSALATDSSGNVYVVDTLNGRVVKLSPQGDYLAEFGELGDTAGALARPKGVAVDGAGRVFVSDGLRAAIEVFGADGEYLGMIGRKTPDDAASGSMFQAPAGLTLAGDTLYVTDRMGGLITLTLSEPAAAPSE